MTPDAQTLAIVTAVTGVITPWLIEIIKRFIGNPEDKRAVVLTLVVSVLVALLVLWQQGKLFLGEPTLIFVTAAQVLGISSTVYQLFKQAVKVPVERVMTGLLK